MDYVTEIRAKLLRGYDEMCKLFGGYELDLDKIKVYGYVLPNTVGATADLNLLVELTFIDKYKRYDWEDVDRQFLQNDLWKLLNIHVEINTIDTLTRSLHFVSPKLSLLKCIEENSVLLTDFIIHSY